MRTSRSFTTRRTVTAPLGTAGMARQAPRRQVFRPLRALVAALLLSGLVSAFVPRLAFADIVLRRDEPVVHLSNGQLVQIHTAVADDASDVRSITYTLHAPTGTRVTSVEYSQHAFGGKEHLNFFADNPPNTFSLDTVVSTNTPGVTVSVKSAVPGVGSATASGQSNQDLMVQIQG